MNFASSSQIDILDGRAWQIWSWDQLVARDFITSSDKISLTPHISYPLKSRFWCRLRSLQHGRCFTTKLPCLFPPPKTCFSNLQNNSLTRSWTIMEDFFLSPPVSSLARYIWRCLGSLHEDHILYLQFFLHFTFRLAPSHHQPASAFAPWVAGIAHGPSPLVAHYSSTPLQRGPAAMVGWVTYPTRWFTGWIWTWG